MATFIVELSFRAEVNSRDAGSATTILKHEIELLNSIAEAMRRQGYEKPIVELKSWEKGG